MIDIQIDINKKKLIIIIVFLISLSGEFNFQWQNKSYIHYLSFIYIFNDIYNMKLIIL